MTDLLWGLLLGSLWACAVFAAAGVYAYRRYARLQERTRQAERLAELGTLTGGLAHEIKNPLSTVQLNLQLLLEDLEDTSASGNGHDAADPARARLTSRIRICERETARVKDILEDFLRYAGRIELDRRPVELNRLCEDMLDFFLPQAQLARVSMRLKRSAQPITVLADERLLKQALLNLILNAVQAMPNGGELILSVSRDDRGEAVIEVIDTGPGIEPDVQKRIFDAYYSTKRSGTGLGLAMTRRIAQEHGGQVTLTSEVGKGSDFALRLPMN
jgi:signal transduction histidine kinase